jgi:hypothetical protein
MAGRRPASTAVTTRWRGGSGGTWGARNRRPRRPAAGGAAVARAPDRPAASGRWTAAGHSPALAENWSCRPPKGR